MSILNLRKTKKADVGAAQTDKVPAAKRLAVNPVEKPGKPAISSVAGGLASAVLLRPRMTEKAHFLAEKDNVFVFEVSPNANKQMVSRAIKGTYKVQPLKVSVVKVPRKQIFVRGRKGFRKGGRKAYVYLKKGDRIETI
jgi:large subunit ribosomal protein L23